MNMLLDKIARLEAEKTLLKKTRNLKQAYDSIQIARLEGKLQDASSVIWAALRAIADKPDLPGRLVYDALHDAYKRIKDDKPDTPDEVDRDAIFPSVDDIGTKDYQRKAAVAKNIADLKKRVEAVEKESGIKHVESICELFQRVEALEDTESAYHLQGINESLNDVRRRVDELEGGYLTTPFTSDGNSTPPESEKFETRDSLENYKPESECTCRKNAPGPPLTNCPEHNKKAVAREGDPNTAGYTPTVLNEHGKKEPSLSEKLVCPMCDGRGRGETDDTADMEVECPNCDGEGTIIALPEHGKKEQEGETKPKWKLDAENVGRYHRDRYRDPVPTKLNDQVTESATPQPGELCWFSAATELDGEIIEYTYAATFDKYDGGQDCLVKPSEVVQVRELMDAIENMRLCLLTTGLSREYLAGSLQKTLASIGDRVTITRNEDG